MKIVFIIILLRVIVCYIKFLMSRCYLIRFIELRFLSFPDSIIAVAACTLFRLVYSNLCY